MFEKQITNRTFASLNKALAAMPQMATVYKIDVYLQKVLYGPRVEKIAFLSLSQSETDENSVNEILDNWHNSNTEYVIRTAEEIISEQSEYIAKQIYGGKKIEVVNTKLLSDSIISESDIIISMEDIEKGKSNITLTQVCEAAYGEFHRLNIGYQFARCNAAGSIETFDKLQVFAMFADDKEALEMLCENQHPEFTRIDKPGWKNGILIPKKYYGRA